jgi:hypothetical protein
MLHPGLAEVCRRKVSRPSRRSGSCRSRGAGYQAGGRACGDSRAQQRQKHRPFGAAARQSTLAAGGPRHSNGPCRYRRRRRWTRDPLRERPCSPHFRADDQCRRRVGKVLKLCRWRTDATGPTFSQGPLLAQSKPSGKNRLLALLTGPKAQLEYVLRADCEPTVVPLGRTRVSTKAGAPFSTRNTLTLRRPLASPTNDRSLELKFRPRMAMDLAQSEVRRPLGECFGQALVVGCLIWVILRN